MDSMWSGVADAVRAGRLGDAAKVSTARPNPNAQDPAMHVICVYTYDAETGTGLFLLTVLQAGSRKMNWQIIREFHNGSHIDGTSYNAGEQIMDALMKDPYGLAISSLHYTNPQVKVLKLARTQDSEYVTPTRETLINGSYPLTRMTYAFLNRQPNTSLAPLTAEFLRFIYSDEGRKLERRLAVRRRLLPDIAEPLR